MKKKVGFFRANSSRTCLFTFKLTKFLIILVMGKRKREDKPKAEGEFDLGHKYLKSIHVQANKKRLIVILSGAQLETVKVS